MIKRSLTIFIVCLVFVLSSCDKKNSTNYYFDAISGDDSNIGTSISKPLKSLSKIKTLPLKSGDSILLAINQVFIQPLELINVTGSKEHPIVVSTYSKNNKKGKSIIKVEGALNGVLIKNSTFITINNLKISALPINTAIKSLKKEMRCGVLVQTTEIGEFENIHLKNCVVENIFYENKGVNRSLKETKSANGTQNYGWGIRFINNNKTSILKNIRVDSCIVKNVSHTGIKFTSYSENGTYGIQNLVVSNSKVYKTGGPGIQLSGVFNGHFFNNEVDQSGSNDDSRKWGRGSGLWTWGSSNVLIEKNRFTNANGPGDSAGAHIDFNCSNIVLQYNLSANNAGGFCEILGNNNNCVYRYNISVNDGYRVKGMNNAFQEGKLFWLSGYNGNKPRKGPFNSYFYNNTMFVNKSIITKMAIDSKASGILIANNIFHIEGESRVVKGDQYKPDKNETGMAIDVVFKNNLFLTQKSWPKTIFLQDQMPVFGNATFKNSGGLSISDYIPENKKLIKNKGIKIPQLPNDTLGIFYGLYPKKDILGNTIEDNPDLGAIEIK